MKNRYFILAAVTALCISCTQKEVIPEPVPVPKNLYVISDNFRVTEILYKTDAVTQNTYIESWAGVDDGMDPDEPGSYTPFLQCIGSDGKLKWKNWLQLSTRKGLPWVNMTVFDTTSDGGVIDVYNAFDDDGNKCLPYMTKINADGTFAWGENGKLFYDFGSEASDEYPCESFVAADNEGGAWIAAGNTSSLIVVARVNSDGGFVTDPILFTNDGGSGGPKEMVRRPQMYVGDNNELYLLLQYVNSNGGVYGDGYYDVIKIGADGTVLNQEVLMPEKEFKLGMRARITRDSSGGAFVIFRCGTYNLHAYLYHFNAEGKTEGFGEVDLNPKGSSDGILNIQTVLDSKTGRLVSVITDRAFSRSYVTIQTVDTKGIKGFGEEGRTLIDVPEGEYVSQQFIKLLALDDGRILMTYKYEPYKKTEMLCKAWVDVETGDAIVEPVADIDMKITGGAEDDCRDLVINGVLRHIWYRYNTKFIVGYDLQL